MRSCVVRFFMQSLLSYRNGISALITKTTKGRLEICNAFHAKPGYINDDPTTFDGADADFFIGNRNILVINEFTCILAFSSLAILQTSPKNSKDGRSLP